MENLVFNPLSDEEVDKLGLSVSDLWMLQGEGQDVQGPFSTQYLNEKASEHEDFFENAKVYNLVIEEWKDFFASTEFQRRKPKLVPAQNLIQNDDFYILDKGQKTGPFSLEQIKNKLESGEIVVSNEVSVDDGKTWIKLYEHHEFDRRLHKNQEDLPFQPEQEVFDESDKVASLEVARAQKQKEDDTAITGLAFLGRGHDKGQSFPQEMRIEHPEDKTEEYEDEDDDSEIIEFKLPKSEFTKKIQSIKWKYVAGFFVFFIISFSAFNTFNNKFTSHADQMVTEAPKKVEQKSINNSDRSVATKKVVKKAPTKRIQPKRYVPKKMAKKTKPKSRAYKPKKISHSYEDFENIDIDDPRVREELSRELAGDYGDEYVDEPAHDDANDYVDDYEQERRQMDSRNMNDNYDNYDNQGDYPNDNYDNYDAGGQEPAYEEVSDFE